MFGLFRKKLKTPHSADTLADQIAFALKSVSMPQAQPSWKLYSRSNEEWSTRTAIDEGYNASAIVYAAVEKRAKAIASVPWVVKERRGAELVEVPNHPLQRLLDRPNPDRSWYEMMYEASQSLDLAGNAYISEIRAGARGLPTELWMLPAEHIAIKPAKEIQLVDHYEYRAGTIIGGGCRIQPEDMIQLRMPNLGDPLFGMPVLMAAGRATDIDRESGEWQKSRLQNKTAQDLHITAPPGATQEQMDYVRDKVAERQSGPRNAGKPLVTGEGSKVTILGQNAQEMDFVNSRRAVWTEIGAVFGTPMAVLGFTEDVNLANAEAMEKLFWTDTTIPQLELLKRQLNHQLAHDFGPNIILDYDLSNVRALQENQKDKVDIADRYFKMGVPLNRIDQLLELGIGEVEGGDVGYLPSGLIPASWGANPPDLDNENADELASKAHEVAYGRK